MSYKVQSAGNSAGHTLRANIQRERGSYLLNF